MRRNPSYWRHTAVYLLRHTRSAVVDRSSTERVHELFDAAIIAMRIRDRLERQHARPH